MSTSPTTTRAGPGSPGLAPLASSPISPFVQVTTTVCTSAADYLARMPPVLDASSSGWAWTAIKVRGCSAIPYNLKEWGRLWPPTFSPWSSAPPRQRWWTPARQGSRALSSPDASELVKRNMGVIGPFRTERANPASNIFPQWPSSRTTAPLQYSL